MLESRALYGAVAQLGERRVRNAKVEGSIPFRSTIWLVTASHPISPRITERYFSAAYTSRSDRAVR
jgi:hypothetical protein